MESQLFTTILTGGTTGLIAALLVIILLLLNGKLVPGYIYKKAEDKLTRYEEIAYQAVTAREQAERQAARGGGA